MSSEVATLSSPLRLRSGLLVANRIAKAATSEKLAPFGEPTPRLSRLYERWGRGGAALLLTGNVAVDRGGLEARGNVVVEDERDLHALSRWADAGQRWGACMFMQLSHAGRQSPRSATWEPVAPSAVPLRGLRAVFARPRPLTEREILDIVDRFARAARIAQRAGFSGVQIHAAHGYLISQFLSPLTNCRVDRWGGPLENRMRFVLEVLRAVRGAVGPGFAVALKLNSADFQRGGLSWEESMEVAAAVDAEGVDLLEISGGSYEAPEMFGRESTRAREAYFLEYAERVRARVKAPLMVTGGFRSAAAMRSAVASGAVDVVGLARPLIVEPDLARGLLSGEVLRAAKVELRTGVRAVDLALEGLWYGRQLERMADGLEPDARLGRFTTLLRGAGGYFYNPLRLLTPRRRVPELAA